MSRVNMKVHAGLLKEARMYLKDVQPVNKSVVEDKKEEIVLTKEHLYEWLEVFYEDRIRMDTCNQASVRM